MRGTGRADKILSDEPQVSKQSLEVVEPDRSGSGIVIGGIVVGGIVVGGKVFGDIVIGGTVIIGSQLGKDMQNRRARLELMAMAHYDAEPDGRKSVDGAQVTRTQAVQ